MELHKDFPTFPHAVLVPLVRDRRSIPTFYLRREKHG